MIAQYNIGDETTVITSQRLCYIRESYLDKYAPYYCVSYHKEDVSEPINKDIPRLLFWEFELRRQKIKTLKSGRQIFLFKGENGV